MKRAIVIGSPGAGKSTFARRLRDVTGLPLYYLDLIWHLPDRTNISREEFDARLRQILEKDEWIIDGNYSRTIEPRLAACDTAFLLDGRLASRLLGPASPGSRLFYRRFLFIDDCFFRFHGYSFHCSSGRYRAGLLCPRSGG